jgi:aminopeptidase N
MTALLLILLSGLAHAEAPAEAPAEVAADAPPNAAPGPWGLEGTLEDRFVAVTTNDFAWDEAVAVGSATVADDHMKLTIRSGVAVPLKMANGTTIGAWFQGDCAFAYTPPLGDERRSFEIHTGLRDMEPRDCSELFLVTDDDAFLSALGLPEGTPAETAPSGSAWLKGLRKERTIFRADERHEGAFALTSVLRAIDAFPEDRAGVHSVNLVARLTDALPSSLHPSREPYNTFHYSRSPRGTFDDNENVTTAAEHRGEAQYRHGTFLTSHPRSGDLEEVWQPGNVDLISAEMDLDIQVSIKPYATMDATAKLTLTTSRSPVSSLILRLAQKITFRGIGESLGFQIDEITDFKGRPVEFVHDGRLLLVRLRSPLPPGQAEVLNIKYTGNAMPRLSPDSFGLLANYPWWPQTGGHDRFLWNVDICLPQAFHAVGTGTTLSSEVKDGRRCEQWRETVPVSFAAINVGRWQTATLDGPRGTKLRGFFLAEESQQMEPALAETARVLEFYESLLGPYPYEELDVALARENMGFWQAPAGLLELSKMEYTTKKTAKKDQRKDFYPKVSTATLAHEIGHQWWGHVVGWKTYRDQWISETFAEYLSFLYMSQHYGEESYLGRLEYWEQAARKTDKYGPATLGSRLGRGRIGQFYRRGPYMLHMLRRLVGDEPFMDWLKQVTTITGNRNLSTGDLLLITDKTLGPEAAAHISGWMGETGLPDLELVYEVQGKKLSLTLKQTQPEPPRQLIVPVEVVGKKGKPKSHSLAIDGRELVVTVPLPPGGLKKVRLDPERELLAGKKAVREAAEGAQDAEEVDDGPLDSDESVDGD